ncbi:hypothetical protein J4760_12950 [Salinicoccus sp. ID82-1]|uniref:YopX family protein n=1 Tax=Salinicoccus sp. ID82-1 TaxID=2820269 RepID=UPI001F35B14A|nr:hypothetical protein [Salinicoccus sp. ID82-1]
MDREIEFRVFDLCYKRVLYGKDIPIYREGLLESIRQFSGQTYELSQYTENKDMYGKKIYDGDIVEVFKIIIDEFDGPNPVEYTKFTKGLVEYYSGVPFIRYFKENGIELLHLNDGQYEIKVIGNRLENKELI